MKRFTFRLQSFCFLTAFMGTLISCTGKTKKNDTPRPNILFAISDDQSFPYASAYGTTGIKTPAFDNVAENGILFNNAFVAAPQCSPSRAAILTGKNIWQIEEAGTHASYFPRKFPVFTDLLENAGYQVGFTGKPWGPGNWIGAGWKKNPVGEEFNDKTLDALPAEGIRPRDYFGNFVEFYNQKEINKPFFFWYGGHEPHRVYEYASGVRNGKDLKEIQIPGFLPDHEIVRNDIADYIFEIEWFDRHLEEMIKFLEAKGELDNTIIVVTADNGMPFPSAKANLQEYGTHVPLAICWPNKIKGNRVMDDLVSLIDLAPTFLEIAGIENKPEMTGKSLINLLFTDSAQTDYQHRQFVLTGRERHTHARPDNLGYPVRAVRTSEYLYVRNFKPELWPAGDPVDEQLKNQPVENGYNPLWPGYHDIDNSPSKTLLMNEKDIFPLHSNLAFSKRPPEQLYDLKNDPYCVNNIAGNSKYLKIKQELSEILTEELKKQGDPRILGYGDIFDSYPRHSSMRKFPGFRKQGEYNPAFIQENQQIIQQHKGSDH